MGMDWIRKTYGVPAKRGGRVVYSGGQDGPQLGTITASVGGHINIRIDGARHPATFHPTWMLRYLDDESSNDH